MKAEYDLSRMKAVPNPFAASAKTAVTIRLSHRVIDYFKKMAAERALPYQSLVNMYLEDCVATGRSLQPTWPKKKSA